MTLDEKQIAHAVAWAERALATPAPAQPDPLHVANERGEGEISGQSRKVISTDFSPKLRWCSYCGEGVTSFCRGKTPDCPMALAAPKEKK